MNNVVYVAVSAALMELREVRDPPPQVRDAIRRLGDALAVLRASPLTQLEQAA